MYVVGRVRRSGNSIMVRVFFFLSRYIYITIEVARTFPEAPRLNVQHDGSVLQSMLTLIHKRLLT